MKTHGGKARKRVGEFKSKLEEEIAKYLKKKKVKCIYESLKIKYTIPESEHTYTPDFPLPNDIIVEAKGIFDAADRKKHLLIRAQHPDLDIRFVFSRSASRISKRSKTTYADWCNAHGFLYADKTIPAEWLIPKTNKRVGTHSSS